jgi:hypothetical protein
MINQLFHYILIDVLSPILMLCFLFIVLCGIAAADGVPIARGLFGFLADLTLVLGGIIIQLILSSTQLLFKLLSASAATKKL